MNALSVAARSKLVKVLGLLASNHDGERAAAGLLATRIVRVAGVTWDELLGPQQSERVRGFDPSQSSRRDEVQRSDMQTCQRHFASLNSWERNFVQSLNGRRKITDGQAAKLKQIAVELRKRGHA